LASFLAIIVIGFAFLTILRNLDKLKTLPLKIPLLLFILLTLFSIFYSAHTTMSIADWLRILSIFSLYVLSFILIKNRQNFKKIIYTIILSAIIPGSIAFYQFINQSGMTIIDEGITNRIFGTFAHPNLLAYYLTIPLALLIFLTLERKADEKLNIFTLLVSLPIFILLLLTYTRGAWIVFLLIILILGALKYKKFLIGVLLGLILLYLTVSPLQNRVNDLFKYKPGSSVQWRLTLWRDSLGYSQEKLIGGYGIGTANAIILEKRGKELGSPDPHNDYLKILIENGVLGLISYLFLIISLLTTLIVRFIKSTSASDKNLYLLFIGITLALYSMSLVDNILRNTALQWILWILLGGLFATYQKPNLHLDKK
jgi:O-antigen ligase